MQGNSSILSNHREILKIKYVVSIPLYISQHTNNSIEHLHNNKQYMIHIIIQISNVNRSHI